MRLPTGIRSLLEENKMRRQPQIETQYKTEFKNYDGFCATESPETQKEMKFILGDVQFLETYKGFDKKLMGGEHFWSRFGVDSLRKKNKKKWYIRKKWEEYCAWQLTQLLEKT